MEIYERLEERLIELEKRVGEMEDRLMRFKAGGDVVLAKVEAVMKAVETLIKARANG